MECKDYQPDRSLDDVSKKLETCIDPGMDVNEVSSVILDLNNFIIVFSLSSLTCISLCITGVLSSLAVSNNRKLILSQFNL